MFSIGINGIKQAQDVTAELSPPWVEWFDMFRGWVVALRAEVLKDSFCCQRQWGIYTSWFGKNQSFRLRKEGVSVWKWGAGWQFSHQQEDMAVSDHWTQDMASWTSLNTARWSGVGVWERRGSGELRYWVFVWKWPCELPQGQLGRGNGSVQQAVHGGCSAHHKGKEKEKSSSN